MALERAATKVVQEIWKVFGRKAKVILGAGCVAAGLVCWLAGRWFGIPAHPGYEMSLMLQPTPAAALLLTGIAICAATAIATVIAGSVRFDAGLFGASVGLVALANRGGPMRYVMQAAPGRGTFLSLAVELVLLGGMLGMAWFGLWLLYRGGRLQGDALRDGLLDRPHSLTDHLLALGTQAGSMAVMVMLLARTDDKKQVLAAVCVASLLATLLAYAVSPTRPSVWFWAGPIVVGVLGYLSAYWAWGTSDPVVWKSGQGGGLLAPLARPLPLDYASLGTAGAILGYWTSRQWQRAKELETEAAHAAGAAH